MNIQELETYSQLRLNIIHSTSQIEKEYNISIDEAYVFGSFAHGTGGTNSDIDILLGIFEWNSIPSSKKYSVANQFTTICNEKCQSISEYTRIEVSIVQSFSTHKFIANATEVTSDSRSINSLAYDLFDEEFLEVVHP